MEEEKIPDRKVAQKSHRRAPYAVVKLELTDSTPARHLIHLPS
jgi:hypothetical protein